MVSIHLPYRLYTACLSHEVCVLTEVFKHFASILYFEGLLLIAWEVNQH